MRARERPAPRPEAVDLRRRLEAVRDQGERPTCLSFAASAVHESQQGQGDYLAVEALHRFAIASDREPGQGATVQGILAALEFPGQCLEVDWPYGLPSVVRPLGALYRTRGHRDERDPLESTLESLSGGHLVVVVLTLTAAWFDPDATGRIASGGHTEAPLGGHAVVATGYDQPARQLLVRNSWGQAWGAGGYGWLPYDVFRLAVWEVFRLGESWGVSGSAQPASWLPGSGP